MTIEKAEMNFDRLREDKGVHDGGMARTMLWTLHMPQATPATRKRPAPELFYLRALGLAHSIG